MRIISLAGLAALTALVTGCPHNDYTVELTPQGKTIARKLDFHRVDGTDSNGAPNYVSFPTNELAAIAACYPSGKVTHMGDRHSAVAEFSGAMPPDVGGAGSYHYLTTSLGAAAIYVERFRGNDDLAGRAKARLAAADQIADLVLGWSRAEFGREPGYKNLRRFLEGDFRHDLKSLTLYSWAGEIASSSGHDASEEFVVRFGQYLCERGYLKIEDAADLMQLVSSENDSRALLLIQKFVADKLGAPRSGPMPKSLAFLADRSALGKSWEKYLAGTKAYRAHLQQWAKEKKSKPDLEKPGAGAVLSDLVFQLVSFGSSGDEDHLTVRLALASAPDHTNGKWDKDRAQVVWESNLESTNRLPVFCYANWSRPDAEFQQQHFGRVVLSGDELLKYCLWRCGLDEAQAGQWETFLSGLQPGEAGDKTLEAFRFADNSSAADVGKDLIKSALQPKTAK